MKSLRTRLASILLALATVAFCAPLATAQTVRYTADIVWVETYKDSSHATETTAAIKSGINYARTTGRRFHLPAGDYLVTTGQITVTDQLVIEGEGYEATRLYAAGAGAVLTVDASLATSTGKGPNISRLGIYSNRATSAAGDIGIKVTNTGSANSAFFTLRDVVIEGAFDVACDVTNVYYAAFENNYFGQYRRHGLRFQSTHTVDAGDVTIQCNTFQSSGTGAGGFVSGGAALALHQAPGTRVVGNKFHPYHAIGVWIHPNATFTTESFPTGMYVVADNQFDSFGSSAYAVVIEGIWGTGVSGETEHGNKVANVQLTGNNLSNCGLLLDIRSEAAYVISATGNHAIGGGGIKISTNAVVDHLTATGNTFDNRSITTGAGASGSGFGPTKPVERLGTVTNWKGTGNHYIGFASGPDMADSSSTYDVTEDATQLDTSTVTRIPGNVGAWGNTWSVTASATDTVTWATGGDTAIANGSQGWHYLHYSGTSGAPKIVAPSGYRLDKRYGDTLPTAVDNLRVGLDWRVSDTLITYAIHRFDTVSALTSEGVGGGGGGYAIQDLFTASNGSINGRTPSPTNTPGNNWVVQTGGASITSNKVVMSTATPSLATNDAEDADVTIEVDMVIPTAAATNDGLVFNYTDGSNYWTFTAFYGNADWELYEVTAGVSTLRDSYAATAPATATTYPMKVVTSGDAVTCYVNFGAGYVEVCSYTVGSRPNKTATAHGLKGYNAGGDVTLDDFRVTN
jgi:hypothetical protein